MEKTDLSSKELVAKSQEGDTESFDLLLNRHRQAITNFLLSKNKSLQRADLEDVLQKAYIKAWRNISKFRNDTAQFSTWLNRIAYHCLLDNIKFNKRFKNFSELPIEEGESDCSFKIEPLLTDEATPVSIITEVENLRATRNRIILIKEQLNEGQAKIFDMIFCKKLSYADAAKELNCPIGTIMSRVFFTRQKIQKLIKKHEEAATR